MLRGLGDLELPAHEPQVRQLVRLDQPRRVQERQQLLKVFIHRGLFQPAGEDAVARRPFGDEALTHHVNGRGAVKRLAQRSELRLGERQVIQRSLRGLRSNAEHGDAHELRDQHGLAVQRPRQAQLRAEVLGGEVGLAPVDA